MEKDKHTTDIVFRVDTKDFKGEVFALFPHEVSTREGLVTAYMHVGQHTSADYDYCISKSRLATEEEAKDLKAELESIGYNIKVVKKRNYTKYLKDFKRVRGTW
jgi:putative ribosome biogenesis GTPase RsgA